MKVGKKRSLIFSGVALALAGVVVGTFAVSQNSTVLNNVFEIANYETQFIEEFDAPSNWKTCDTVDKKIYVKNNTDVDIVARVKLDEEWNAANGMGLPLVSNGSGERMAIVNMTDNSGWTLDGTYYYSPTLEPGDTSTSVISGVTLNCDANLDVDYRYGNAQYKLSAKVETIQADRAPTEWHKISVWQPIQQVKYKMMGYVFNGNNASPTYNCTESKNRKFLQADSLGIDPDEATENQIISDSTAADSNTPTYLWYDEDNDIIYWYSDADDVYMTTSSNNTTPAEFGCFSDLSGFYNVNTSRATNFEQIFRYYRGTSLHGLEKWDVSNATSFYDLFWTSNNGNITDISALSRWDVSNVEKMRYVFTGHSVSDVSPLAGWNVSGVKEFDDMFASTNIDESLCDLADWPINKTILTSGDGMFGVSYRDPKTDARCLDPWDIPYEKASGWFNTYAFILPSWARM